MFGGRRRTTSGSLQHLVGSDSRRSILDSCCWYGPVTLRCLAACIRSRPFLFFIYVVLALVLQFVLVYLALVLLNAIIVNKSYQGFFMFFFPSPGTSVCACCSGPVTSSCSTIITLRSTRARSTIT